MQKKLFCIIIASLFHCLTALSQEIYIIKRGETLESIAKNRGVSASEIQELNPLVDLYCTGMEILLPERKVEVERHSYSSSSSSYSSGSSNVGKKRKNGFLNFLGNVLLGVGEAMFSGSYHSHMPTPPMPVAPMPVTPMPVTPMPVPPTLPQPNFNFTQPTFNFDFSNVNVGSQYPIVDTYTPTNANDYSPSTHEDIKQKNREYYENRYGYKDCHICGGDGICKSCNGSGRYLNGECPNCYLQGNVRTGKCGRCQGSGKVYGVK